MIISRTPLRISFFGGGTDYREYFERKKGAVMGTTIDKYTYISVNRLSSFFEYKYRVSYSKAELVKSVDEIQHPSVRETLKFKKIIDSLDIHIFTDLPARTGLGSSSSFTVGFLNALYALHGQMVSKQRLAEEAMFIEQEMTKENVGCQDQMHVAYGGFNIIEFTKSAITIRPVIISNEKLSILESSLMCFYTGLTRTASEIAAEQIQNIKSLEKDRYLDEMYQLVFEAEKVIINYSPEEMIKNLGKLLDENWKLKKSLSSRITNDLIDEAYDIAIKSGAYGGKLLGAGGGGFLVFIVDKNRCKDLKEALRKLPEVEFKFENSGSTIIYMT